MVGISISITYSEKQKGYMYIERPYVTPTDIMKKNSRVMVSYFCFRAILDEDNAIKNIVKNSVFFTFWDSNIEFACQSSSEIITDRFLGIYRSNVFESKIEKFEKPSLSSAEVYRGSYIFVETKGNLGANFFKQGRKFDVELNVVATIK